MSLMCVRPQEAWSSPSKKGVTVKTTSSQAGIGRHPLLITVPNFLLKAAGALGDLLHKMGISSDLSTANVTMLMINNHYNATKAENELGFKAAPADFREILSY